MPEVTSSGQSVLYNSYSSCPLFSNCGFFTSVSCKYFVNWNVVFYFLGTYFLKGLCSQELNAGNSLIRKPPEFFALEMSLTGAHNTLWIGLEILGLQPKAVCHLGTLSRKIMKNNVQLMSQAIHHSDSDGFQDVLKWGCFLLRRNIVQIASILNSGSGLGGGGVGELILKLDTTFYYGKFQTYRKFGRTVQWTLLFPLPRFTLNILLY